MKLALLLAALAGPAAAEEVWVLETGPVASESVPLKPVQPVEAWRGFYTDSHDGVWLYVTRSPNFFLPAAVEARRVPGTPWTAVGFFPESWAPARRTAWLDAWQKDFLFVSSFPRPGWPVVFPSVLKPGLLTKG